MKTTRTYRYKVMAGIAGACLLAACTDDRLDPAQEEGERYDGPLRITAWIDGQLMTRTAHPDGEVKNDSTVWYLSCPLKITNNNAENEKMMTVLKATFGDSGYASLTDTLGAAKTFTWSDLTPVFSKNYLFVMDNVPRKVFSDRHFYSEYQEGGNNVYIGRGVKFTKEEVEKYKASLETEEGGINSNDLIQGYVMYEDKDVGKKSYIEIPLTHLMARLSVEMTDSMSPGIALDSVKMKVWIDHLASESYALNRLRGGNYEQNTLVIHPLRDEKTVIYDTDSTDADFYNHTFYLLGDANNGDSLLRVKEGENTYRTHKLILPPQSTHVNQTDLRPRIHIEVGEGEETRHFSAYLPISISFTEEEGKSRKSMSFDNFESGWDIILTARFPGNEPEITFDARVQRWNYRGSWTLETLQGGIYDEDQFKEAVKKFNEYVEKVKGNGDDEEDDDDKKEKDLKKLKRRLGHFGHWEQDSVFVFEFFTPLGDGSGSEEAYPDSCIVDSLGENLFNADLKHHSVYGCDGNKTNGKENLKARMLGRYVANGDTLKNALEAYDAYVQFMVNSRTTKAVTEEEKAQRRKALEKYGWWKPPESDSGYWHLHINIVDDIVEELPKEDMTLNATNSTAKQFLELEMNGHEVWGKTDATELENEIYDDQKK